MSFSLSHHDCSFFFASQAGSQTSKSHRSPVEMSKWWWWWQVWVRVKPQALRPLRCSFVAVDKLSCLYTFRHPGSKTLKGFERQLLFIERFCIVWLWHHSPHVFLQRLEDKMMHNTRPCTSMCIALLPSLAGLPRTTCANSSSGTVFAHRNATPWSVPVPSAPPTSCLYPVFLVQRTWWGGCTWRASTSICFLAPKKSKKSTFGACSMLPMLPMLLPHHTLGGKIHYSPHFMCQISIFWAPC